MHRVVNWVKANDLCFNTNKTKVLIFSNSRNVYEIQNFSLTLDNILLQNVQQFKCLGLIIDNKLNWEAHINNIARLSFLKIRYIFSIKQYLPSNYLILIGQSLVLSIISYRSCIWGTAAKKYLKIVEKVIRALARLVLYKKKFDPIAESINNDLHWLFPEKFCDFRTCCIMFKLYRMNCVSFFDNYYKISSSFHNHATRSSGLLYCTYNPKLEVGRSTFLARSTFFWNSLPENIRNSSSYYIFKRDLKSFLLNT